MAITYRMNGRFVEVLGPDGSWQITMPPAAEQEQFDDSVWRWRELALANEERTGVPANYMLGTIQSESGGDPKKMAGDGGVGLTMITHSSLKRGLSNAEVAVPEMNIEIAADFMKKNIAIVGFDIPKLASMFNGGGTGSGPHLRAEAPWGYHEYKIPETGAFPYISRVVRTSNFAQKRIEECGDDCGSPGMSTQEMIVAGLALLMGAAAAGAAAAMFFGGKR